MADAAAFVHDVSHSGDTGALAPVWSLVLRKSGDGGFRFGNSPDLKRMPLLEGDVGVGVNGVGCIRWRLGCWAGLAVLVLLSACQLEQVQIGQYYSIHTVSAGACPGLTWTFVADPQRRIAGHVSDNNAAVVARVEGTLNADDSYHMVATNLRDGHTADVDGQFSPGMVTLSVRGAGDPCDGRSFRIRFVHGPGMNGGGG